jgi:hypothetical protein
MRTFKEKITKTLDDVHCDCCGKSTTHYTDIGPDYATLESCWGYGSINDGTKYSIDLCEYCFFEVLQFIRNRRKEVLGPFQYPYDVDPLEGIEYL